MKIINLEKEDKKVAGLVKKETRRQRETIDLIASENVASPAVREALGTVFTNKYAEGYPGKRYYPGNVYADEIEELAQKRALALFGLAEDEWGVNVQPYSGSPANLAIYLALAKPGETIMGMKLMAGGHLTHGHPVSATGIIFKSAQYGVDEKGFIDYEEVERLAKKEKPKIIISGTTAYPRKIDFKKFGEIARKVGAYHVADISHIAGLVAAGLHPSPFPYADAVMTTTHKTLRGPRGAIIFATRRPISKSDPPAGGLKSKQITNSIRQLADKTQNREEETVFDRINKMVFPGVQGGPHVNVIAAKAVAFKEAVSADFRSYQKMIVENARVLAEEMARRGVTIVTGGTDNHLVLADVKSFGISGSEAESRMERSGIIANRNTVPGDDKPFRPSGVRLGTPAVASRGMGAKEMKKIAELVVGSWRGERAAKIKHEVAELCRKFPLR